MNCRSRLARLKAASALFAIWSILCGCSNLRSSAKDPSTTVDTPNTTSGTTGPVKDVPQCVGGNRGHACLLGANCRITEQGCQVCQCLELQRLEAQRLEAQRLEAIPWPCIHEFYSIVTHPRIFSPPSSVELALDQVAAWMESPYLVLLAEEGEYWPCLQALVSKAKLRGPAVHDGRIAALCRLHGVQELWTADRDFSRMDLKVSNPLLG